MKLESIAKHYRIEDGADFRLAAFDPADRCGLDFDKDTARGLLAEDIRGLADQQERLFAEDRWAMLIVLQAMDAAGKDGVIKHVTTGLNPQGCEVHPFKRPTPDELDHDFLWRAAQRLPARGRIGIFNRSYYEEVLAVRVHPEFLENERLPPKLVGKHLWKERFKAIRAFERHLVRNGTVIVKFFLHISKEEQRRRFLDRLEQPAKRWKFSMNDVTERKLWDQYMAAYEHMIRNTSRPDAPWYVVPADHKPFAQLVVAQAIVDTLEGLKLKFPQPAGAMLKEMNEAKKALLKEK